MVTSPLLERLGQRSPRFRETQFTMKSFRCLQDYEAYVWEKNVQGGGGHLCAHTGLQRGKEQTPSGHGWFRPKSVWAWPAWPWCPFLLRRPGEAPQTAAPSRLLASWACLFYLLEEKWPAAMHLLWLQQAAFVPPNPETLQKATAGRALLPGKGAALLEHSCGKKQCIYAPGPMPACASFEMHTHARTTQTHQ